MPYGVAPAADFRGGPARVPDLPWPYAGRRVPHPGLGDRPDPHPPPDPRRARGARRAAEPAIDASPHAPGRVTRAAPRRRPDRPLSTAPSPRHHAGTCGVGGRPTGASDRSPPASPPPREPPFARPTRRASKAESTPPPVGRCSRGRRSCRIPDRPQSNFLSCGRVAANFVVSPTSHRRAVVPATTGVLNIQRPSADTVRLRRMVSSMTIVPESA